MKPYPAYKDSGIEWIGAIPEHWNVVQIKRLSPVKRGASPRPIEDPKYFDDNGEFAWVRIADVSSSDRYLESTTQTLSELGASLSVKRYPGDLFLSIAGTVGKPIITTIKCCIHDGFVWFPNLKINPEYLYYIFSAGEAYKGLGKWGTQLNLNTETVGSIPLPFPPEEVELEGIINFLDYKTSQLDTLIEMKQKQIELLKEERTAIINQAVTKGLNPDVPMKDSGIEWLGEVPEHWEIMKLKYASNIFFSNVDKKTNDGETIVRSCNYVDVYNNEVITEDINFLNISATKSEISKFLIKEGDVLATKDSETPDDIAVPALVKCSFTDVVCGYHLAIIRPLSIIGEYLFRLLQSEINYHFFIQAKGITRFGLSTDSFNNLLIPLPPMSEQLDIILHIKEKLSVSESLIDKIQNQITLLQEYRTALISNAVTGKIDVRDTPTAILE